MDATLLEKAGSDSEAEGAHAFVEELDEHPVLAALVREEAGVSVCGRTISPSRSTGLRMLVVFLPVLYTLSLSVFGSKVTASFDGCATRDGTPRSLDTCFACNGNTTVVHVRSPPLTCTQTPRGCRWRAEPSRRRTCWTRM